MYVTQAQQAQDLVGDRVRATADERDPASENDRQAQPPVPPDRGRDCWKQRGGQNDRTAEQVGLLELRRRPGLSDHSRLAAKGVVQAVGRIPSGP